MNTRWLLVAALIVACSPATGDSTTSPTLDQASPEAVAEQVASALSSGDPALVTALTHIGPMPWVALVEGATVEEAANLDEAEAAAVAHNFWTGFLNSAVLAGVGAEGVRTFEEGNSRFARFDLPHGSVVLKADGEWRIDVVASFAAPLAQRLLGAIDVVIANPSPAADELRQILAAQRDSVAVALADPTLESEARALVEEVLQAVSALG